MGFLTPLALALGLLAGPILLLYLLRLRRRTQAISSTLLWRQLTADRAANAPWQRLRRNWLLLLQLLVLAALVFALARPFLEADDLVQGNVILLLDASASMLATDGEVGSSRFDDATQKTAQLIDGLSGSSTMTLIEVGPWPRVLVAASSDKAALQQGLSESRAYPTEADWQAAIALANGIAQSSSRAEQVLLTDGGLAEQLPPLQGSVRHIPVGVGATNAAISTLAMRPTTNGQVLLAGVTNFGVESYPALLTLYLDGSLFDARQIDLAPGERVNLTWDDLPDNQVVEAQLSAAGGPVDILAVDDRAWATTARPVSRQLLLISDGNLFLEQVLRLLPGTTLQRIAAEDAASASTDDYDIVVYDGVPLPDPLPETALLIINPQPAPIGQTSPTEAEIAPGTIRVGDVFTNTAATRLAESDLLQFVDWSSVAVGEARAIQAPGLEPLIESEGGPLLMAGERQGQRIVILPFALTASDLPLRIAFPVMMANTTGWLSPGQSLSRELPAPSEPVSIAPDIAATRLEITGPDGILWTADLEGGGAVPAFVPEQPGLYELVQRDRNGNTVATEEFAVNFQAFAESNVAPIETLQLGRNETASISTGLLGQRELWPWLVAAGLVLVMLEWWISHPTRSLRRQTRTQ